MASVAIISVLTCLCMIAGVLFFPKIKIGKIKLNSYWIITLIGAIIVFLIGKIDVNVILNSFIADRAINPIKILVLFISMTILSIFLDELGFFSYLANATLKRAKTSQVKLFLFLYITVSILTVFTSNDVIILSFTPFICYFAKNAKINPMPYLAAEFIAANTWSMALIIGNPTNIYLATSYGVDFIDYVKVMAIPTLFAGITAFIILFLIYRKKLQMPIQGKAEEVVIKDKLSLIIGVSILALCTIALALSSYISVEMWLVSLIAVITLFVINLILSIIKKSKPNTIMGCLKRAPWELIPFVSSMFIIIIVLENKGVTRYINNLLGQDFILLKYGITSFLTANVINNIPMSALFASIISPLTGVMQTQAVFASIVGSNLGAFLTPIGALAGIMWSSILNEHKLKFNYVDFIKMGAIVSIPTIIVTLFSLSLFI